MHKQLLLEITSCPEMIHCLKGDPERPCSKIVNLQESSSISDHQLPEPWSGEIDKASILFISSNPSISNDETFPTGDWDEERICDYFHNRFSGGKEEWIINGTKSLRKDGSYGRATMFWAGVKSRAKELLEQDPVPGVDYALTELVHCKSKKEQGVPEALDHCVSLYFGKVLAASNAKVLVGLGNLAKNVIQSEFDLFRDKNLYGPLPILGTQRMIALLPHPNARMVRSFEKILTESELFKLRSFLEHSQGARFMGKKVVLVSCVSKKDDTPRPAADLYLSSWFKKASAYAKQIGDEWYILSAEHGILSPSTIIDPYDVTLNNMKSPERKSWARKVVEQLKPIICPGDEVIFLAGTKYRENLIANLEKNGVQISIPMEGLRIGEQMSWLNKKIQ